MKPADGKQEKTVSDHSTGLEGCVADAPDIGGEGTALLVDDDQVLYAIVQAALVSLGFAVLGAKNGLEAVEVFRQHRDVIRVVLCDVIMPHMNGWETLAALRRLAPGIPVILSSGYDQTLVMDGDHLELPQVFLGKPYGLQELRQAIHQALTVEGSR